MRRKQDRIRYYFSPIWRLIRLPVFAYLGLLIFIVVFERQLVFQPTVTESALPSIDASNTRSRFIQSGDHEIHCLMYERETPAAFAIYFHGNGGNIVDRSSLLSYLSQRFNLSLLGVSYSGYGLSEGSASEESMHQDADVAFTYLCQTYSISAEQVVIFGESMGGAVATRLASKNQTPLLVLDSTFSRLTDVAQSQYPWLPIHYLLRSKFPAIHWAPQYRGTVIQTHGTEDQVVPHEFGVRLSKAFPGETEFYSRDGGRHNEAPPQKFYDAVGAAIARLYPTKME